MSTGARLVTFAAALVLALLVAEGALTLVSRRSLAELWPGHVASTATWRAERAGDRPASPPAAPHADVPADQPAEDATRDAIFAQHDDPLVGCVLKRDADLARDSGTIRTDELGLRRRPGPPPSQDALRLVVLGGSIAFGSGVGDDQVLAARLEARLAELRGPGERPVACRTVAVPGWNHRAAPAFLLDHWDELRPDIVLYLPSRDDVCDTDGASAEGRRRVVPDPASSDPWLSVSASTLMQDDSRRLLSGQGEDLTEAELGADALFGDLCAESRARHDASARSLVRMQRLLEQRGCRLAVVWSTLSDYTWFLSSRLAHLAPDLTAFALLETMRDEFTLGSDAGPNAETLDVWACWLAAELVEQTWVTRGAGNALPPAPEEYARLRGHLPDAGDFERLADEAREKSRRLLRPEIDFHRELGLLQVLGGLNPGRTARENVLVILAPQGRTLELELEPLATRPDLYPLQVAVTADGAPLGSVTIRPDAVLAASLPLPESLDRGVPLEVRLVPERWVVRRLDAAPGSTTPAPMCVDWCRPLRIACRP